MPPARWLIALRAQGKGIGKYIGNPYLKLELDNNFAQREVFSAYGTELPSPAYSLLNASMGFDILGKGKPVATISIAGQNLADAGYQNHLSRLRYADVNNLTGRRGIFGMGRNISLSLSVPIGLK
jgi:iron complex outermembrane receptor protein